MLRFRGFLENDVSDAPASGNTGCSYMRKEKAHLLVLVGISLMRYLDRVMR